MSRITSKCPCAEDGAEAANHRREAETSNRGMLAKVRNTKQSEVYAVNGTRYRMSVSNIIYDRL